MSKSIARRRDQVVRFHVTELERELIRIAAMLKSGGNVGDYIRSRVLDDADRLKENYPITWEEAATENRLLRKRRNA